MRKLTQKELDKILARHAEFKIYYGKKGQKADLSNTDCSGLDFSNKNCIGIDFTGANCQNTNFTNAICFDTNFTGANCEESNFTRTDCEKTNFANANCWRANFTAAYFENTTFTNAYCRDANFTNATCRDADFMGAILPFYKNIPEEGSFIAWKKLSDDYLAKILITEDAKRCSSLVSPQGRANKIKILAIYDKEGKETQEGIKCWFSEPDQSYKTGETYTTKLDEGFRVCCVKGFHFFINKEEAQEFGK